MYNLIVSGQDGCWNGAPFQIELSRAVREYTDDNLEKKFSALDEQSCAALRALPSLFAYETSNKQDARLGIIKRIRSRRDEVRLEYKIAEGLPPISPDTLLRLQWELDLGKLEMNRTHWAVKDVDLLTELLNAQILTRGQAARYEAVLVESGGSTGTEVGPRSTAPATRASVFISYAHKDKKFLDELLTHLKPLQRDGRVSTWSDRQLKPGTQWLPQIESSLSAARIALLLVTKDFLASDFIHKRELSPLLNRARENGITILWVLVRDCNWKKTPLATMQSAYPTEKPLAQLTFSRDSAWVKICETLEAVAGGIHNAPGISSAAGQATSPTPSKLPPLELDPKGYYVEERTERKVCGLCWEKHSRRITLLDHRKPGPAMAVAGGGAMKGFASWTDMLKCPDCGTEYNAVHRSRDF